MYKTEYILNAGNRAVRIYISYVTVYKICYIYI
nr:MAG TPA: hypothetical protein [Caudoviricetes sp.]